LQTDRQRFLEQVRERWASATNHTKLG